MAKVTGALFSMGASGQVGHAVVFDKRGYVRTYKKPGNPQSDKQMVVRDAFGDIQHVLKVVGTTLRATLKTDLGYRWNSLIISDLTMDMAAKITSLTATYNAFSSPNKSGWVTANPGTGFIGDKGLYFYMVCQSLHDVTLRVKGTAAIAAPTETNSAAEHSSFVA
jgi:hypothetical protein